MTPPISNYQNLISTKFSAWWHQKSADEQADIESCLAIAANALGTLLPIFIISSL